MPSTLCSLGRKSTKTPHLASLSRVGYNSMAEPCATCLGPWSQPQTSTGQGERTCFRLGTFSTRTKHSQSGCLIHLHETSQGFFLCSPGWPGTPRDPPASLPLSPKPVRRLKVIPPHSLNLLSFEGLMKFYFLLFFQFLQGHVSY